MSLKVTVLLVVSSLFSFCDSDVNSSAVSYSNNSANLAQIALELDKAMYGNAYARGTYEYEHRRPVHNGACKHIFPAIIAVPHNTEDVSLAVQTAVIHGLPVSFRSGGHSFICQVEPDPILLTKFSVKFYSTLEFDQSHR